MNERQNLGPRFESMAMLMLHVTEVVECSHGYAMLHIGVIVRVEEESETDAFVLSYTSIKLTYHYRTIPPI